MVKSKKDKTTYSEEEIKTWEKMLEIYRLKESSLASFLTITCVADGGKTKDPIVYDVITEEIGRTVSVGENYLNFVKEAGHDSSLAFVKEKFSYWEKDMPSKALFEINRHFMKTVESEYKKSIHLITESGMTKIDKQVKLMSQEVSELVLNAAAITERLKKEVVNRLDGIDEPVTKSKNKI